MIDTIILHQFLYSVNRNNPYFGARAYPLLLWTVIWDFGNVTTTEQPHLHRMPKTKCPDQIVIRSNL